ncbi:MAG: hypothetical protein HON90_08255 [Halobacteriovoraceae bacterium]|jgi:HD-GYP domain-containing protein (c-di-GMP phosphodiesterase class II)|nr:hypothetical protein [Halobacteriovoraceae bacterium]
MKILFLGNTLDIKTEIVYEIKSELATEFIYVENLDEWIRSKEENTDIEICIINVDKDKDQILRFEEYIINNWDESPILLYSKNTNLKEDCILNLPPNVYYNRDASPRSIVSKTKEIIGISSNRSSTNYYPIRSIRFKAVNSVVCDVYIKLGDNKFVKIIGKNDLYDNEQIQKYIKKGITTLYVLQEDYFEFCRHYSKLLGSMLATQNKTNLLKTEYTSISFIHEITNELGLSSIVVETIDDTVNSCMCILNENDHLLKFVDKLKKEGNYLYKHSQLLIYVSCAIALEMNWSSDSTLKKLSIASILHDITLENEELALIDELNDDKFDDLSWRDIKTIKNHSLDAFNLIAKSNNLPPDIESIVRDHHERPDGSGFPRGLFATNISPLSCIFILAEDFVHQFYEAGCKKSTCKSIIERLDKKYSKGNFRKPLEGIKKCFL